MRPIARLLLAACLSLFCLPLFAESLDELYQVREPVSSQQPEERDAALQRALDTLILKLTGDPAAIQNPALQAVRSDPQQLVLKYGYQDQALVVDFDPATTQHYLRQAGLSLWGASRPTLLVWWLNDAEGGTQLVGDGQEQAHTLQQAAEHRGLPLRLPMADLDEQLVATAPNLASGSALQASSARYDADAVLAVHALQAGDGWQARWRLTMGNTEEEGTAQAADTSALADAVMLAASERLASRFVARPGAAEHLVLEVAGADLARYAELDRVLEAFAARLRRVDGDRLVYRLESTPTQLRSQLALIGLQEAPAAAGGEQQPLLQARDTTLHFHW